MDKLQAMKELGDKIAADESLPLRESNLVFGEGSVDCKVMFIGEGPGYNEDVQRRPFVGRGGQLLREMIRQIGWREEDVYITNIVKRRPPENRDPLPEEVSAYTPYLSEQIKIINPPFVVPLGRFAMNHFLLKAKITRDQGKAFRLGDRVIIPMLHPAAALRGTEAMAMFRESFKKLPDIVSGKVDVIDLPVPAREPEITSKQASLL